MTTEPATLRRVLDPPEHDIWEEARRRTFDLVVTRLSEAEELGIHRQGEFAKIMDAGGDAVDLANLQSDAAGERRRHDREFCAGWGHLPNPRQH